MEFINLVSLIPIVVKILFVCVGNTCRSQMAEAIARSHGHVATSAGTHPGEEVNANAMRVLTEGGIDCSGLYPKSLDDVDTTGHDKIISMGCGVQCPNIPIDIDWGLEDPLGQSIEFYRFTMQRIADLIRDSVDEWTDA
tara:strand:+ start:7788 stop:8204 length:417 start_codon:yes stop_codon:yes gene_type:complete